MTNKQHQHAVGDQRRTPRSSTWGCEDDDGILEQEMIEAQTQDTTDESVPTSNAEENLVRPSRKCSSVSEAEEEPIVHESEDNNYHTSIINGIVLEYLELLGLKESYEVFSNECKKKGILLPLGIRDPIFLQTKFTLTDVETFFKHFDNWEGEELSNDWSKFSDEVEDKGSNIFRQSFILLRIYIASLPFRKNEDSAYKLNALDELREFHQAYSEEFIKDPVCIALFAFPFVTDPDIHPAFTGVFTDKWQLNLRKQLKSLFEAHFETVNGVLTCDLKQMYHHYIEEVHRSGSDGQGDHLSDSPLEIENKGDVISRAQVKDAPVPGHNESTQGMNFERPISKTFTSDVCAYMKKTLIQSQDRYCKLLRVTSAVVIALEQAVQGKAQDIHILQSQLQESFPELFDPKHSSSTPRNQKQIVYKKSENFVNARPRLPVKAGTLVKPKLQIPKQQVRTPSSLKPSSKQMEQGSDPNESVGEAETDETTSDESEDVSKESESVSGSSSTSGSSNHSHGEPETPECSPSSTTTTSQLSSPPLKEKHHHSVEHSGRFSTVNTGRQNNGQKNLTVPKDQRKVKVCSGKKNAESYGVKHKDSKAARVISHSEKFTETEDQEIPEEFCQYFPGLSPQHGQTVGKEIKNSLLPPSVSDPFPSPPRTYEVSPRSTKLIYIPSSLEVGCISRISTAVCQAHAATKYSSSCDKLQHLSKDCSLVNSLLRPGVKKWEEESLNLKPEPQLKFEVDKEQKVNQEKQHSPNLFRKQFATRVFTPPTEKKSTAMASIMGALKIATPTSHKTNAERQGHHRTPQLNPQGQLKWFRNMGGDASKLSTPSSSVFNQRPTKTQPVNSSIQSKVYAQKKYSSDDQGHDQGQPRRIYKIGSPKREKVGAERKLLL